MTKEEEAIVRASQIYMIYAHSSIMYEIIMDSKRSNTKPMKLKPIPHAYGIIGWVETTTVESLSK